MIRGKIIKENNQGRAGMTYIGLQGSERFFRVANKKKDATA